MATAKKKTEKRVFKKKGRLSKVRGLFRKWEEWDKGDSLVGKFISKGKDQFGNPSWSFEVIQADFADDSGAKFEGKVITLNSAGFLNKAMEDEDGELKVEAGEAVEITYNGKEKMVKGPNKGKPAHTGIVDMVDLGEDDEDESVEAEEEEEEESEEEEDEDDEDMDL